MNYLPILKPVHSLNRINSQKRCGKEARRPNKLVANEKISKTGLRPILSERTPPPSAPNNQPANTREVERLDRMALSQTKSN